MLIADQLKPQQKLSASSRSFAVAASLNPGLVDKFHLKFLGKAQTGGFRS
jgi:hypothetical protein